MVKIISQGIAIIFHPFFIVLYSYLIYFNTNSIYNQMLYLAAPKIYWPLFSFIGLMAVFFPLLTLYIMYKNKVVSSISIPNRTERIPVLILVLIYYSMTYYIFRYWNTTLLNLLEPFISFLFGGLLLLLILTLITLKWKISLHSASISGLAGGIIAATLISQPGSDFEVVITINVLLLSIIGLVSFSRVFLNAHNVYQVLAGVIIGFVVVFETVFLKLNI